MPKLCEFENCRKQASFGLFYGKGLRCKEHKTDDMKPQFNICPCGKGEARYNYFNEKKKFCSECKSDDMIDIAYKSKMCVVCKKKWATFNYENEKKATHCNKCKLDNMIDIRHKKCIKCNKKQPCYSIKGENSPKFCAECSIIYSNENNVEMENIRNKKCLICNLTQPSYSKKNETTRLYCSSCAHKLMNENNIELENNVNEKCIVCKKVEPCFNYENETKPTHCGNCKLNDMINIKCKKCIVCKITQSCYNYENETKPSHCAKCKLNGMIHIYAKSCKSDFCDTIGNKKYKGYCTHCYANLFPNDPLTFQIKCKTKEIAVRDFINTIYDGFQHDKPIHFGCDCNHRRRIDHRKLIGNTMLAIETDENQHKTYDEMDEEIRYDDLMMAFTGKWIYIRFNPDKFKKKNGKNANPAISTRLHTLKNEIDKQIKKIENEENTELLEIHYLFYDNYN